MNIAHSYLKKDSQYTDPLAHVWSIFCCVILFYFILFYTGSFYVALAGLLSPMYSRLTSIEISYNNPRALAFLVLGS